MLWCRTYLKFNKGCLNVAHACMLAYLPWTSWTYYDLLSTPLQNLASKNLAGCGWGWWENGYFISSGTYRKKIQTIFEPICPVVFVFFCHSLKIAFLPPRNWLYRLSRKDGFTRWSNKRLLQTFSIQSLLTGLHGISLLLVCFVIIAF